MFRVLEGGLQRIDLPISVSVSLKSKELVEVPETEWPLYYLKDPRKGSPNPMVPP